MVNGDCSSWCFAILREGFETALFWWRPPVLTRAFPIPVFFGGLLLAVLIGYLIVVQGRRIQLKKFFSYTSLLLVVFCCRYDRSWHA